MNARTMHSFTVTRSQCTTNSTKAMQIVILSAIRTQLDFTDIHYQVFTQADESGIRSSHLVIRVH